MGVGDPFGMAIAHAQSVGMGGMRTSGDLVARVQMSKRMKIREAKKYVADKLGIDVMELADPIIMGEIREDLGLGTMMPTVGNVHKGMESRFQIAKVLDIPMNCVERFKKMSS